MRKAGKRYTRTRQREIYGGNPCDAARTLGEYCAMRNLLKPKKPREKWAKIEKLRQERIRDNTIQRKTQPKDSNANTHYLPIPNKSLGLQNTTSQQNSYMEIRNTSKAGRTNHKRKYLNGQKWSWPTKRNNRESPAST